VLALCVRRQLRHAEKQTNRQPGNKGALRFETLTQGSPPYRRPNACYVCLSIYNSTTDRQSESNADGTMPPRAICWGEGGFWESKVGMADRAPGVK